MAEKTKIVRSPVIEDIELPEVHYHNDIDQPAISLSNLPTGTDHSTLTGVTSDQHHAKDHVTRHLAGGGDAFTGGNILTYQEVDTTTWAKNIIPDTDSARDLGSTTKAWANLYVDTIKSITGNALALTPIAGQSLTVNLSTTGDFLVNTSQLVVDTSAGYVGIGTASPGYPLEVNGNVGFTAVAKGLVLKQGANGKCGTFVANGVTPVTVSNTSVAITDTIIISLNTVGGTVGVQPHVATITAATGFTVICTALDTSTYNYAIISNAA